MKGKVASVLFCCALFFFILTFSIGLPIYCRPCYYAHIDAMELQESGFSKQEIIDAYNEVLDYLTVPWCKFGTGVMDSSEDGAAHFADCKALFMLNAAVLLFSLVTLIVLWILNRHKKICFSRLGKRSPSFWAALAAIVLPLILGGLAALNFDQAFEIFHSLFFPGKNNFRFNPYTDEIIKVLPQDFFMNCAILIGCSVLVISSALLIYEIVTSHKRKRSEE